MNDTERFLFDLNGYLIIPQARAALCSCVCCAVRHTFRARLLPLTPALRASLPPQVFTPEEVAACNAAIDERVASFQARTRFVAPHVQPRFLELGLTRSLSTRRSAPVRCAWAAASRAWRVTA